MTRLRRAVNRRCLPVVVCNRLTRKAAAPARPVAQPGEPDTAATVMRTRRREGCKEKMARRASRTASGERGGQVQAADPPHALRGVGSVGDMLNAKQDGRSPLGIADPV